MKRRIHQLERHVILCGYGRFGQIVAPRRDHHSGGAKGATISLKALSSEV